MGFAPQSIDEAPPHAASPVDRTVRAAGIGCSILLAISLLSLSQGTVRMAPLELLDALMLRGTELNQTIIWGLRMPRTLAAVVVGAALGASGALMQGMLRNGLASPFLLGISPGAGLVAVAMLSLGILHVWVPFGAWVGAIVTTVLIYVLAWNGTTISTERLILGGVAASSLLTALQSLMLLLGEDGRVQAALTWLIGSLSGRGWQELALAGPYIAVALVGACLLSHGVNLLNLGDELSIGLGMSPLKARSLIGATATLLVAGAVSIAGLVGFVGLIVPHGVRRLVGTDYRVVVPFSALGGAVVLSFADMLSRLGTVEVPVGIVTALLGSLVFIWLLYRRPLAGGL